MASVATNPADNRLITNIFSFWRSVEALSPQNIPRRAPNDKWEPTRDWRPGGSPPWLDNGFRRRQIGPKKMWRHGVYSALYDRQQYIDLLKRRLGGPPNVFEERTSGNLCVFYLAFDEYGHPLVETLTLSMATWAYGIIETEGLDALSHPDACDTSGLRAPEEKSDLPLLNSGFPGFDTLTNRLREELAWRVGNMSVGQDLLLESVWFDDFAKLVVARCRATHLINGNPTHRVKSVQVRRPRPTNKESSAEKSKSNDKKQKRNEDFLNSFFINDLNRLIVCAPKTTGKALRNFMCPPDMRRVDVRSDRLPILSILQPGNFPEGCWPAKHPLVWGQQVAVNALWSELRGSEGIFSVNGPPGTGKTTMLRDLVAAIIVERAKLLANRGSKLFGVRRTIHIGDRSVHYSGFTEDLSDFSIVVASSNNGAVENVSMELPKEEAIDEKWADHVSVYSDLAGELLNEPAWAMIAGRLGNKSNRSEFVERFWWGGTDRDRPPILGLRHRLDAIIKGSACPEIPWGEAVEKFTAAAEGERKWRSRLCQTYKTRSSIQVLGKTKKQMGDEHARTAHQRLGVGRKLNELERRVAEAEDCAQRLRYHIENHKAARPGIIDWMSTLGGAHTKWRKKLSELDDKLQSIEHDKAAVHDDLRTTLRTAVELDKQLDTISEKIDQVTKSLAEAQKRTEADKRFLGDCWPKDFDVDEHVRERSSPWSYQKWRHARIRLFLSAMNLHRAFVEENAARMIENLGLVMDVLKNGTPNSDIASMAFENLALVCPVISTTFASVGTLFDRLGVRRIGWLLIDEAGQAAPQIAAGAIWRSRRVVVVGDPMQLEPIVTIPSIVEAALASQGGKIDFRWHPSRTSVQRMADQATPIGSMLGDGEGGLWVGAPLRVHRRCDDPMFSISNVIAYGGLMVHHKRKSASTLPVSAWINVPISAASGNWLPAEGSEVNALLDKLIVQHGAVSDDIFLISPFRDVVRELRQIGYKHGLPPGMVGTVHTTQGKEAHVVILVLGGGTEGAREWVASKPNLLNVAVSRAKSRIYIVGGRNAWARLSFFEEAAKQLEGEPSLQKAYR